MQQHHHVVNQVCADHLQVDELLNRLDCMCMLHQSDHPPSHTKTNHAFNVIIVINSFVLNMHYIRAMH